MASTGSQLRRREGLGDIVVSADHKTADLIHLLSPCSKHYYSYGRAFFAYLLAYGKAVNARHHYVQQHDVEVAVLCLEGLEGSLAAVYVHYVIACTFKVYYDEFADSILVLAYKYTFHPYPLLYV